MSQYLKHVSVVGLHGRFDLDIAFSEGVNIVYGVNGSGKTTLLHILTNAANLDLERFAAVAFETIRLDVAGGPIIEYESRRRPQSYGLDTLVALRIDGEQIAALPVEPNDTEPRRNSPIDRIEHYKKNTNFKIKAIYFPAFRSMGEAWSFLDRPELLSSGIGKKSWISAGSQFQTRPTWSRVSRRALSELGAQTIMAREVFGEFVPVIDYPSPRDIQRTLDQNIREAVSRLASEDRLLLSEAFNRVFETISQESIPTSQDARTPETIKASIEGKLEQIQTTQAEYGLSDNESAFEQLKSQLDSMDLPSQEAGDTTTRVLRVYEEALDRRYGNLLNEFAAVRAYIDAVNQFLEGKRLVTALRQDTDSTPRLQVRHSDGRLSSLETLSSGERQVAGLVYAASRIDTSRVILVDEPELSLHIDWQRKIIGAMEEQLPSKQLIVCTHSAVIGAQYADQMIELSPPTASIAGTIPESDGNGESWSDSDVFDGTG